MMIVTGEESSFVFFFFSFTSSFIIQEVAVFDANHDDRNWRRELLYFFLLTSSFIIQDVDIFDTNHDDTLDAMSLTKQEVEVLTSLHTAMMILCEESTYSDVIHDINTGSRDVDSSHKDT